MLVKLLHFPAGRDHYQVSGQAPWQLDEVREVDALEAQRLLEDFGSSFALVVDEEPDPVTVGEPAPIPVPVVPAPSPPQKRRKGARGA